MTADGQGRPGDTVGVTARPVGDGDGQDGLREALALRVLGLIKDVGLNAGPSVYDIADAVLALPEVAALRAKAAAADRVRELHHRVVWPDMDSCAVCLDPDGGGEVAPWPCPTIRALDGDGS